MSRSWADKSYLMLNNNILNHEFSVILRYLKCDFRYKNTNQMSKAWKIPYFQPVDMSRMSKNILIFALLVILRYLSNNLG